MEIRIMLAAIIMVLVITTGIILSKRKKPYNFAITTLHKLLSLAMIILCTTIIYRYYVASELSLTDFALVSISALFFLSAIVSGGLLTIESPMPEFLIVFHKITSVLSGIIYTFTVYRMY